jgi:tRNA-specific 2-thiouridylase
VQHRYRGEAAAASVVRISKNSARVRFDEPQLALTPGQGAAFYLGMRLVGGGWIERALRS